MPMNPAIPVALLSGISNIVGGARQARQQRDNINRTNRANREMAELAHMRNMEMADYQHSKNIEMWKMQNQYNSPTEQMKRFTDAGLNPNLIYGQGTAGNASSMPQYQQVTYQPPQQDFRGKQDTLANVTGSVLQTGSRVLEAMSKHKDIQIKEEDKALKNLASQLQSMKIPGANLQYLKDIINSRAFTNIPIDEQLRLFTNKLKSDLSASQQKVIGNRLSNEYQIQVNRLAKQNMSLGDNLYVRLLLITLEALGINTKNISGINK